TRRFLLQHRRGLRQGPPPATVPSLLRSLFVPKRNVADVMAFGSRVCSRRCNVSDPALRGAARNRSKQLKNQNVGYDGASLDLLVLEPAPHLMRGIKPTTKLKTDARVW